MGWYSLVLGEGIVLRSRPRRKGLGVGIEEDRGLPAAPVRTRRSLRRWCAGAFLILGPLLAGTAYAGEQDDDVRPFRWLGVQVDAGVPDGATLGLVARPGLAWTRVSAAYSFNVISSGFRGGISLDPIKYTVAPTLSVEVGHVFKGKLNGGWFDLDRDPEVGYDYLNLHLGFEVGDRDSWRLLLHGGLSRVWLRVDDIESGDDDTTVTIEGANANATVFGTAKIGFVILF